MHCCSLRLSILLILLCWLSACTTDDTPLPTLAVASAPRSLVFWESQTSTLDTPDQRDTWQFVAQSGAKITLRAVESSGTVQLTLLRNENVLAQGDAIEVTLPETGTYTVQVQSLDDVGSTYDIGLGYSDQPPPGAATTPPEIVGVPTPTPAYANLGAFQQRLTSGGERVGRLTSLEPQHVYTYDTDTGGILTLELERVSGTLDPFLTLYDPQGNAIAMDDDSAGDQNARLRNVRLSGGGVYSIQVDGTGFYGDYTLRILEGEQTVSVNPVPVATVTPFPTVISPTVGPATNDMRLSDHVPVIGNIRRTGGFQRFAFEATAGETVSVVVQRYENSQLLPQIELFDPNGAQVSAVRSTNYSGMNGVAAATNIPVEQSGVYILIITGENGTQGAYTLAYGTGSTVVDRYQGETQAGMQFSGTLRQPAERHIWEAVFNAGESMSISVSGNDPAVDPVLEIVHPDGRVLYRDDNSGANNAALVQQATFEETNRYLIRVHDASGQNIGSYTLLWRYLSAAPTDTPVPNAVRLLEVTDTVQPNAYEFYVFQGSAGQQIRIRVAADPSGALDPVAALLDPAGQVIAEADDDDGLNPLLTLTLPADGSYTLRVNGYLSGGSFTATVSEIVER